jgi:serine/threonine-protein kinase
MAVRARLGSFEVLGRLATGGMAEILLGRRRGPGGFEKRVALKRVLPHLAVEPLYRALFADEVRLHAALDHPHVVQLFDAGEDEQGAPFFAMELVAGSDLAALIALAAERGTPLSPLEAGLVLIDVASGLHAVHEAGVVHRDVTPANLLVSRTGVVKLADFGVAAPFSPTAAVASTAAPSLLPGKVPYLAPEQAAGAAPDPRSDLYSLAVCGWELFTGRRLFAAKDPRTLWQRVRRSLVRPLSHFVAAVPPRLEEALMRALARDPRERFPTALDFAEAIEEALVHAREGGPLDGRRRIAALVERLVPAAATAATAAAGSVDEHDQTDVHHRDVSSS